MFSWQDLDLNQPINWAHPLNRGRVAWWLGMPLVYGTNDWPDLVNGSVGALTSFGSGFGWNTASNPGGAGSVNCNGTSNYINLGSLPSLNLAGPMTILAWVNLASVATGRRTIAADCSSNEAAEQWDFYVNRLAGKLGFAWGPGTRVVEATTVLTANTWYRVGATRSGSTGNWTAQIAINGAINNSGTTATNPSAQQGAAIGRQGQFNGIFFFGSLNDVTFYNRALSAPEIAADYWLSQQGYPDVLNWTSPDAIALLLSGGAAPAGALLRNLVSRRRFEPAYFE